MAGAGVYVVLDNSSSPRHGFLPVLRQGLYELLASSFGRRVALQAEAIVQGVHRVLGLEPSEFGLNEYNSLALFADILLDECRVFKDVTVDDRGTRCRITACIHEPPQYRRYLEDYRDEEARKYMEVEEKPTVDVLLVCRQGTAISLAHVFMR